MKILNNKKGVTVLEGIIALGLLAVVTVGAFGVLLSAARKSTQPDMREEMALAVENAKDKLQIYINTNNDSFAKARLPSGLANGLCGGDSNPLQAGTDHHIKCLLPKICDASSSQSAFSYKISSGNSFATNLDYTKHREGGDNRVAKLCNNCSGTSAGTSTLKVTFTIKCNGYEL